MELNVYKSKVMLITEDKPEELKQIQRKGKKLVIVTMIAAI